MESANCFIKSIFSYIVILPLQKLHLTPIFTSSTYHISQNYHYLVRLIQGAWIYSNHTHNFSSCLVSLIYQLLSLKSWTIVSILLKSQFLPFKCCFSLFQHLVYFFWLSSTKHYFMPSQGISTYCTYFIIASLITTGKMHETHLYSKLTTIYICITN